MEAQASGGGPASAAPAGTRRNPRTQRSGWAGSKALWEADQNVHERKNHNLKRMWNFLRRENCWGAPAGKTRENLPRKMDGGSVERARRVPAAAAC